MGKIQVLDKLTIDKIAAGEVVERPLNVVKELVENAIDAGADSITVEIKDGGVSLIRVTDNGSGIASDDLPTAFLRHSTSKISKAEDLMHIHSLGFRGEALSSICAVSQMEVITKTATELMGNRLRIEGGVVGVPEQTGAPDGTTMIVRNLFYNTPARRNFLKTAQTEAGYISGMMEHLSLSNPDIAMRFIVNGQTRLQTAGNGNGKDLVYRIFGRDVMSDLMPFSIEEKNLQVEGYIAKPALSRGNRNYENFFVNGRYVKSTLLSRAVEEGYKTFIMQHKFPFVLLYLTLDPTLVDVNVHPTKMEVRFQNEASIYDEVVKQVRYVLSHQELIAAAPMTEEKKVREEKKAELESNVKPEPFEAEKLKALKRFVRETSPYEPKFNRPVQPVYEHKNAEQPKQTVSTIQQSLFDGQYHLLDKKSVREYRIIGEVFDTYWLIELKDSLYIVDQHAAHERILYEKTMERIQAQDSLSQQLSPPMVLTLSDKELNLLEQYRDSFKKVGFCFESFGGQDVMITEVPYNMLGIDDKELFLNMIDELESFGKNETPQTVISKVAMLSCKAAVKGNQRLSVQEARHIMEDLMELENPYHCPHGRPTIIEMKKTELERRFHR
ncbi:MAG: DNA mismatch repair endonuclease MutL [Lachnospiraceae bacterium]